MASKLAKEQLEGVETVFVSTDAPREEFLEFKSSLEELVPNVKVDKFEPSEEDLGDYKDGGVAIIDQIICSHAR